MRLNRNDSTKTELLPWVARSARAMVVCVFVAALASACKHEGNAQIDNGTLGLSLSQVSGNNQGATPSFVYTQPLTLQALDTTAQVPIPYAQVDFTVLTPGSDAIVLIPTVISGGDGMVQTRVRAPSASGQTIQVEARIRGTTVASVFQLNTSQTGTATQFIADTTHGNVEVAGVPFGFIVKIADANGNPVPSYNGPQSLVWSFVTASSWTGSAPSLPPNGTVCNFVNGVCTTPSIYTVTDSRTTTLMYIGDGPGGLQDEFGKPITVLPNSRDHLIITTKAGGPAAGASVYPTSGISFNADQGAGGATKPLVAAVVDIVGNYIADPATAAWTPASQLPAGWAAANSLTLSGVSGSINPIVVGSCNLSVTDGTLSSASVPVSISLGATSQLVITTQPSASYTAGVGLGVRLEIRDAENNVITSGSDSTATVTLALYQSGIAQPGKQVGSWSMSALNGVALFAGGTVLARPYVTSPGSSYTVRASATTASPLSTGDSSTFTVTAGADFKLAFTTQPAASTCTANGTTLPGQCAGVAFSTQPVVAIQDQYGNPSSTTGATVFLVPYASSGCPGGTVGSTSSMLPGANPSATSSSGTATFSGVGYKVADSTSGGPVYLMATSGGLSSACSNSVLVKPAQANTPIYVAGTGLVSGVVGTTHSLASEMPQFKIVDNYGNGVPNYTVSFAWTQTGAYGQSVTASTTTNNNGIAQPSTFTLQNVTGYAAVAAGACQAGTNSIQATTTPNIGSATSATINITPAPVTSVSYVQQPQAGASNQGQTLNTAIQTQPKAQLNDTYGNCAYNVPNGTDTFTFSLYSDAACTTSVGTVAGNTVTNTTGQGALTGFNAASVPATGTGYYMRVIDSTYGFTACSTSTVQFYNPIGAIYFNTVGTTVVSTAATTGSVLLIVKNGVPSSYTWSVSSAGSRDLNCALTPSVSASFTGGSCPAGYTCSNYAPGCVGGTTIDIVQVVDGSGTTTANNLASANITVTGASLAWLVATPTSWGSFSAATTTTYTLKNAGNGSTGIDLASTYSSDSHFTIQTDNCTGVALPAGGTCTIVIKFDPTAIPALSSGANRTGSVFYSGAPGGQTATITFDASKL